MKKCCATKKRSFWNEEAVTVHLLVFEDFKYSWRPIGKDIIFGKWWVTFMFL